MPVPGTSLAYTFAESGRTDSQVGPALRDAGPPWHRGRRLEGRHRARSAHRPRRRHVGALPHRRRLLRARRPRRGSIPSASRSSSSGGGKKPPSTRCCRSTSGPAAEAVRDVRCARTGRCSPASSEFPSDAAPRLQNTSHTITAHVTVPESGCEGALYASGDRWGGYAMFVQDGLPCFHYHFPLERHELRRQPAVDPRRSHDHVDAHQDRPDRRPRRVVVDGTSVATVDIPRIIRGWMPFSGLDIGCDNGAPVGTTYESPFRFTGSAPQGRGALARARGNPRRCHRAPLGDGQAVAARQRPSALSGC